MWEILICMALAAIEFLLWKRIDQDIDPRSILTSLFAAQLSLVWVFQFIRRVYYYPYYLSPLRHLPTPTDHCFPLGQALNQFQSHDPNEPYLTWVRKWPNADLIRYMGPLNSDALLAVSVEAHVQIMKTHCYAFTKPGFYRRIVFPAVGRGLVFQDGEEHKRHRKIVAGSFSPSNLRTMMPIFHRKAEDLCDFIDAEIGTGGEVIELVKRFSSTTLDVIGTAVLGIDLQSLRSATPFHELYRRAFEPSPLGTMLMALNAVIPIRWINVGENRRFNETISSLHNLLADIIRWRLWEMDTSNGLCGQAEKKVERTDLLTYIIQESRAAGENWTEKELLGHTLTLMAAGHETTSNALVWTIHLLTLYPAFQDRLRQELFAALANDANPDHTVIDHLPFLDKIFREVLRLCCPATYATREALHDVTICGVTVPRGTPIMLLPAAIHRNPRIWGANAESFDPDRWDNLQGEAAGPHSLAAFFMGPRTCIGQAFVRLEFKHMLMALVSRFRFERVEEGPIPLVNPSVVLRPKGGLRVKVRQLGISLVGM